MVKWTGSKPVKVQLTVYVHPKVKRGLRVLAGMENKTTSKIVEALCIEHLSRYDSITELIGKGEESK